MYFTVHVLLQQKYSGNFRKKLLKILENVFGKQVLDFVNFPTLFEVLSKSKKAKITGAYSARNTCTCNLKSAH
jgi:hypothetical protein